MNIKKRKSVCAVLISVWVFSLCGCVKKVDEAEFAGLDSIEVETVAEELGEPEAANGEADGAAVVGAESGEPEAVAGEGNASQEKPDTDMYIHVCGAVMQPGVYCMQPGERIYQAIEAAGGFAEDACDSYCNQAMELTDGMKLWIPTMEEAAELPWEAESLISTVTGTNGGTVSNKKALLNINTATIEQLCTLSGIGEAKARAIVEYREQKGDFSRIEDIMKVAGIKQTGYDKIKDSITVG